jgi:hypothetical protein
VLSAILSSIGCWRVKLPRHPEKSTTIARSLPPTMSFAFSAKKTWPAATALLWKLCPSARIVSVRRQGVDRQYRFRRRPNFGTSGPQTLLLDHARRFCPPVRKNRRLLVSRERRNLCGCAPLRQENPQDRTPHRQHQRHQRFRRRRKCSYGWTLALIRSTPANGPATLTTQLCRRSEFAGILFDFFRPPGLQ